MVSGGPSKILSLEAENRVGASLPGLCILPNWLKEVKKSTDQILEILTEARGIRVRCDHRSTRCGGKRPTTRIGSHGGQGRD